TEHTRDTNLNPDAPTDIDGNDFKARPIAVLGGMGVPDLAVTSVTAPAHTDAGNPMSVTWTVKNTGFGVTDSPFYDLVFLSSAPVLGTPGAREISLGRLFHTDPVNPGDSYTATQTFDTLPDAAGKYVIVKTGLSGDPTRDDDTLAAATDVTNAPADLRV